jgi:hypothetical protein
MRRAIVVAGLSLSIATSALAQVLENERGERRAADHAARANEHDREPPAAADPADVATPESVVKAINETLSGRAGEARNWNRFRSLMAPDARFVTESVTAYGAVRRRVLGVEDLITSNEKTLATQGFFEHRVVIHDEVWAHLAVIVTAFEIRHAPGEAPFARGIKHFELTSDGKRWFVESVVWEGETTASPLPPEAAAALEARAYEGPYFPDVL